jgi:FkbM family methyltransferase
MFEPYIITIEDFDIKMLIVNERAKIWYDKPDSAWITELQWTVDNVDLGPGRVVIDGGCHYGLYTIFYASQGAKVFSIDVHQPNLDMAYVNTVLNRVPASFLHAAIAPEDGYTFYNGENLGTIVGERKVRVPCYRLPTLRDKLGKVDVVKLDIEGAEYSVLPDCIDDMPEVDTWIVEFHPFELKDASIHEVMGESLQLFLDRGFDLHWIDRSLGKEGKVVPYPTKAEWRKQSTVIATKEK